MNESKKKYQPVIMAIVLIAVAATTRFIPHPFNFTAVGAMALFSGAVFRDKRVAFLLPVVVMFFTDMILGFHFSILPVYACFALTVWMGTRISNRQNSFSIGGASIISSIVFFLVTNLPVWYIDQRLYPNTIQGTIQSYTMAMPFFQNQVLGDLIYNALLFGVYYLVTKGIKSISPDSL